MRRTTKLGMTVLAAWFVLATGCVWAQENREGAKAVAADSRTVPQVTGATYHLDFVVKELDGSRVLNSRSYSTSISEGGLSSIRAGARVSVPTGSLITGGSGVAEMQYVTLDLGANLDCRNAKEAGGKLAVRVTAELSSIAANDKDVAAKSLPVVRQNKWDADVIVPLGKATTIFSSDDVSGKSKMQVELTATLIK